MSFMVVTLAVDSLTFIVLCLQVLCEFIIQVDELFEVDKVD